MLSNTVFEILGKNNLTHFCKVCSLFYSKQIQYKWNILPSMTCSRRRDIVRLFPNFYAFTSRLLFRPARSWHIEFNLGSRNSTILVLTSADKASCSRWLFARLEKLEPFVRARLRKKMNSRVRTLFGLFREEIRWLDDMLLLLEKKFLIR